MRYSPPIEEDKTQTVNVVKIRKLISEKLKIEEMSEVKTGQASLDACRTLINTETKNRAENGELILGKCKFKALSNNINRCTIMVNTDLATIKVGLIEIATQKQAHLYYCPRFISIGHELIHVEQTRNNTSYKDVPLDQLPLIKLFYNNLEEIYTTLLDPKLNEVTLAESLGYNILRFVYFAGTSSLLGNYVIEKISALKSALVKGAIMLDQLNLSNEVIERFCKNLETPPDSKNETEMQDYNQNIDAAYLLYKKCLESEKQNMTVSSASSALIIFNAAPAPLKTNTSEDVFPPN